MTALKKYARLEATGLWRPNPQEQRREVVVSMGDATLVIAGLNDRALAHWSIAAVERRGTSDAPAIFYPDGDPGETLELNPDEAEMIEAIDTLRRAIVRARPRPGRLRWLGAAVSVSLVAALGFLWLPGALRDHALKVVPDVTRAEISNLMLDRIARVSGPPCRTGASQNALARLAARTGTGGIVVLRSGVRSSLGLPDGRVLVNRALIEDPEEPDVVAGYILAETIRNAKDPVLRQLLESGGLRANITLLTTGRLPPRVIDAFVETVLSAPREDVADQDLLTAFDTANIRSTAYAYARDITGETTLPLIEGDPMAGRTPDPILSDADWLRLQSICGG